MKKLLAIMGAAGLVVSTSALLVSCGGEPKEEIKDEAITITLHVEGKINISDWSDQNGVWQEDKKPSDFYFSRQSIVEEMDELTAKTVSDALAIEKGDFKTFKESLAYEARDIKHVDEEKKETIEMGAFEYTTISKGGTISDDKLSVTGGEAILDTKEVKPVEGEVTTYQFVFYNHDLFSGENSVMKTYAMNIAFDATSKLDK